MRTLAAGRPRTDRLPRTRVLVFAAVLRDVIEAAMCRVDALARPPDDPYFDELLAQHRRVRRFLPGLVRAAHLGATPAAKPLLAAVQDMSNVGSGSKLPVEFIPAGWHARVVVDGVVDPKAWTLCLVAGRHTGGARSLTAPAHGSARRDARLAGCGDRDLGNLGHANAGYSGEYALAAMKAEMSPGLGTSASPLSKI